MLEKIVIAMFGDPRKRAVKRLYPTVDKVTALEPQMKALTDEQLQAKTVEFRQRWSEGASLESLRIEAFAVCREAAWRVLKMRHFDVQILGGLVLHQGSVAEMKTGEGKTLCATLPLYLEGLTGQGAHLVTVNDYLAKRDCEWMGKLYNFLGLSVGVVTPAEDTDERRAAYEADITYVTNNELGFDYLRDNMKFHAEDCVQRDLNFAIVDECDSILIDEARTPLIISGSAESSVEPYYKANDVAKVLAEKHFQVEEKNKSITLTEEGAREVEKKLNLDNIFDIASIQWVHYISQALRAIHLFKKEVDYMVVGQDIIIVDEFTGRLMDGRRWGDGLHQAVEAKEGVGVKQENQTLASITFQNYFRMYDKLAGMTGTALTEAEEFSKIYNLDVYVIPTNKPITRKDENDVVYKNEQAKYKAIVEEIKSCKERGQPVLVGTASIARSEEISNFLNKAGIRHNVLNAKHHEREASIIAQAGRKGSVTISTNMAGRGTDIVLGGNFESMTSLEKSCDDEGFEELFKKYKDQCEREREDVLKAGGLCILGTERHESRRIDNQLRGRSGRQGDPGRSRFFLSAEDDLMRIFNGEKLKKIMTTLNIPDDEPIEAKMVSSSIEGAQRRVEGHNFDIRKHLLEYDDVMNQQRTLIYDMRRKILFAQKDGNIEELEAMMKSHLESITTELLDSFAPEDKKVELWNKEPLVETLNRQFMVNISTSDLENVSGDKFVEIITAKVKERFEYQKTYMGELYVKILPYIFLESLDFVWKSHLAAVDHLKDGIGLRAHAQKNPLIEYRREAFEAFETMMLKMKEIICEKVFTVQLERRDQLQQSEFFEGNPSGFIEEKQSSENPFEFLGQNPASAPRHESEPPPMNRAQRRRLKKSRGRR